MGNIAWFLIFILCMGFAIGGEPPSPERVADREIHRQQERDRVQLQQMRDIQQGNEARGLPFSASGGGTGKGLDVVEGGDNDGDTECPAPMIYQE